jgi:probable FeS assembly SUF system protein SufT
VQEGEDMMHTREPVSLGRDCRAIQIPEGLPTILPAGSRVLITQQLGGSFTVMTDHGALFRIDEQDGDALGRSAPRRDGALDDVQLSVEQKVWSQLRKCYDPEIPVNVVDLGLIYSCELRAAEEGSDVDITMTLTAPGCGMGPVLAQDVKNRVEEIPDIREARVEVVFDPPWNQNMMTDAARLELGFM